MSRDLLACCGSLTLDNVVLADGTPLAQSCGGNVVYSALAARLWHDRVGLVARIGVDYPRAFLGRLEEKGLDLSGVVETGARHGMNVAFSYRPDGSRIRAFPAEVTAALPEAERPRFTDYTTLGPDHRFAVWTAFSPEGFDLPELWLPRLAGVHCAAMPVTAHLSIAKRVRSSAARSAWLQVDSPWYDERDLAADHARPLFALIDALLPSEEDVHRGYPKSDLDAGAARILEAGARLVVLKRGGAGCLVLAPDRAPQAVPALVCDVVDLTGAGDAFCGGFLAGMALTGDVLTAVAHGAVSASFAIEGPGLSRLFTATPNEASERLRLYQTYL